MFVLDIETVPNEDKIEAFDRFHKSKYEDKGVPYEDWRIGQMSLIPAYAKLCGMGFWVKEQLSLISLLVGDEVTDQKTGEVAVVTEEMLLKKFWFLMQNGPCVGFNVINFDVHIIRLRSMHYSIIPSRDLRNIKPWEKDAVHDLAQALFPDKKFLSMKETYVAICPDIAVPDKYESVLDFDGSMVYAALQAGNRDTVRLYQEFDVWRERMLANRTMNYF